MTCHYVQKYESYNRLITHIFTQPVSHYFWEISPALATLRSDGHFCFSAIGCYPCSVLFGSSGYSHTYEHFCIQKDRKLREEYTKTSQYSSQSPNVGHPKEMVPILFVCAYCLPRCFILMATFCRYSETLRGI